MPDVRLIDATMLHAQVFNDNGGDLSKAENVAQILLRIENAPTIDAQPVKRGHWEKWGNWLRCSQCGVMAGANYVELLEGKIKPMTSGICFCCGAKMDGGDADETP